jgi:hypothetical protein
VRPQKDKPPNTSQEQRSGWKRKMVSSEKEKEKAKRKN